MIVSIHQPAYLPWLGYFDKINQADLFIYLDTVQFQKGSFQNRNKVLTRNGPVWLTVPVETSGRLYTTALKDLTIDNRQTWQAKHLSTVRLNYSGAQMYREVFPAVEPFYHKPWARLSDLCWEMLLKFNEILGITTPIVKASEITEVEGKKSEMILSLCRSVKATTYLSGSQGKDYLDLKKFAEANMKVLFQDYVPRPYRQQGGEFVAALGVVDLLFNEAQPRSLFDRSNEHGAGLLVAETHNAER